PGALVRVDRLRGPCGRVDELCGVPHALTLPPEGILQLGRHPVRVLDEGAQLDEPRLCVRCAEAQLVQAATGLDELAPGPVQIAAAPELLLAGERVEDVQLVRGAGEPALLELA